MEKVSNRVHCCLMLHNACVTERVMGDCRSLYNPAHYLGDYNDKVDNNKMANQGADKPLGGPEEEENNQDVSQLLPFEEMSPVEKEQCLSHPRTPENGYRRL